jgi:hypothetical protein
VAVLVAVTVLCGAIPGDAATPQVIVDRAGTGGAPARNITLPGDLVSIYNFGPLQQTVADAAIGAAVEAGGWGVYGRGFGIGMFRVTRAGVPVHAAPGPAGYWFLPMSVTALPLDSIGVAMGRDVSNVISSGMVVMGQTSATLNGAQAGDVIELLAADGSIVAFTVGRVAPDAEVGGTEIVMSTAQADALGATLSTSVLIYGNFNRSLLDAAMASRGLTGDPKIRVRRSWDAFDPDSTIGLAKTKTLLGELAYHVTANDGVLVDDAWRAKYIPPGREAYPTGIVAACNNVIKGDIAAALQEVVDSGLAGYIDVGNANTYGGCFGPRFTRVVGTQLGTLSRHTWGQALDTNTVANCQGCVPKMDCRIVRIFRKHNFAWGGNFIFPDGMHFEWVGEPRNTYQYPSRYCPNVPSGGIESAPPPHGAVAGDSRSILFTDDLWTPSDD